LQRNVHALGIHRLALRARIQAEQHRFGALIAEATPMI